MFGLDEHVAELAQDGGLAVVLLVAVLLGLRHATDPDHVTAVSTLVLSDERHGARRASMLGLCWGLGHGTTLVLLGLPIVLFSGYLPDGLQRAAEFAVGVVIVVLAVRLLIRWRRGQLHSHTHRHGAVEHSHPHLHEHADGTAHAHAHRHAHDHPHADALGRSPLAAFGIGLVHGVGGSAGVGVLLIGAISDDVAAIAALVLFAAASGLSMALVSSLFGHALSRRRAARRLEAIAPVIGVMSLLFGVSYALGATGTVPYVL